MFFEERLSTAKPNRVLPSVSLFSNCGAGDVGFAYAGFDFKVMAELEHMRMEVCQLNHTDAKCEPGDLRDTWTSVIQSYRAQLGEVQPDLLSACPPCQGMSSARGLRGNINDPDGDFKDDRNLLALVIGQVALELQPKIVVVENVPQFLTRKVRHPETGVVSSAASLLTSQLEHDYEVFPLITDLCEFGVPQTRKRCFLTFIRRDSSILKYLNSKNLAPYPAVTHPFEGKAAKPITAKEALTKFGLPALDAKKPETALSNLSNGLHRVPVLDEFKYKMVAAIPPDSGRSAWQNDVCLSCNAINEDLASVVCRICGENLPRPIIKDENGAYRLISGFGTSYKRMSSHKPAATILTASGHLGSHNTIHPFENRILSAYECALLQTFPQNFEWGKAINKWGMSNVRAMIGEAVPPLFTFLHGKVLSQLLQKKRPTGLMEQNNSRILHAQRTLKRSATVVSQASLF